MPWKEITPMSERREFVSLARRQQANVSEICRRYGVSRKTAYKWLARAATHEQGWEMDQSRRPLHSPSRIGEEIESAILAVRDAHPAWGGRKIRACLMRDGWDGPPAASTITEALRRAGRIAPEEAKKRGPMERFEREQPNELWQMDFKGHFSTASGPCHPLTILDDHSRYALCVAACADEREATVRKTLTGVFRLYGLPARMLMDNGSCWKGTDSPYTKLTAWLMRLGVNISHGRPYHPQTQGKTERFNRTLKDEALEGRFYDGLAHCQRHFDLFRACYNMERPHESLGMAVPLSRYRISPFAYPETLAAIEYLGTDIVRSVGTVGYISYEKSHYQVGRAFSGEPVALRATERDGVMAVYYCRR
jgi:transposase InsO family protein